MLCSWARQMDTCYNIYVTHVVEKVYCPENPNFNILTFWGQKEREISVKLKDHLDACQFHSCPIPTVNDLKKSDSIFCVLVNSTWLRATINNDQIIEINKVDVFCIDYGLTQSVPLSFIRLVPHEAIFVRKCPPLATQFLLGDVVVQKGQYGNKPVLQYLKENVENKLVQAVSLGYHAGFEGVRIYMKDVLLAKLLVEGGMGRACGSYSEALQRSLSTQTYFSLSSKSTPVRNTRLLGLETSTCSTLQTNRQLVNTVQHQTQPSGSRTYTASSLAPNTNHLVIVTHVQNGPENFIIQLKSAQADHKLALISQRLAAFADTSLVKLSNPDCGVPCIAVSSRVKMFHRGLITQKNDSNFANVYFVDFGFSELIDQELLFEIPDNLIAIDLHAMRVSLAEADSLMDLERASEIFTRMVLNKVFYCRVVGSSAPLAVVLSDNSGQSVKDLVISSMSSSCVDVSATLSLDIPITNHSSAVSTNSLFVRANIKVNPVEVEPEEKLFVTFVGPPGHFFGQLERRRQADLKAMERELISVYSECSNLVTASDIPLLYADVQCHLGDYALVKWSADGNLYRVKIVQEDINDVAVDFIDYGNSIRVPRREIWAPVKGLKQFCQPPFGIQCLVSDVNVTADQWENSLAEKSIGVKLKPATNGVYPATLGSHNFGVRFDERKVSCLSRESPAWVPPSEIQIVSRMEPNPTSVKMMRQLLDTTENALGSTVTMKTASNSVPTTMSTQSRALSSCSMTSTDLKIGVSRSMEADWSMKNSSDAHSVFSNVTKTGIERTEKDFGRLSDRMSLQQNLSTAEPVQLFYPDQSRLESATKQVEVVFAENPSSFYCQLAEALPQLDALMETLNTAYSNELKPCAIGTKKGVACVSQYTADGAWYRGEVLNVEGSDVDILFVDYGNKQRTPINLVKAIDETFLTLPHQAYHCSLSGVPDNQSWTAEEKMQFQEITMDKSLTATFVAHCENDKYQVQLVENIPGSPLVINKLFGALTRTAISPPVTGYSNLSHSNLEKVNVAWFYGVERFFLSPVDLSPHQENLGDLEKFYSSLPSNEMVENEPRVGLPCVTRFTEDGLYYRSQILAIRDQVAKVLFVDFGNEQNTPITELKRIHPDFMKYPQLTWHCRLKDVKLVKNLPADAKQHMDTCFLSDVIIEALFHPSPDTVFDVELKIPQIGNAVDYLLQHKVVESTLQTDVVLAPQFLNFPSDKIISVNAVIPFVISPVEFWIQFDSEPVDRLMEHVGRFVRQPEFMNKKSFIPSVGKPCLAFYAEDERWYRATVQTIDGVCCTVYYIDYGNCCSVKITDLKDLPEDLANVPAMAFKCCLEEAGTFTKEVAEAFQTEVLDLMATVKFVQTVDGILRVRLFDADGVDIGEKIGLPKPKAKEVEIGITREVLPSCSAIEQKWKNEEDVNQIKIKKFSPIAGKKIWCSVKYVDDLGHLYVVRFKKREDVQYDSQESGIQCVLHGIELNRLPDSRYDPRSINAIRLITHQKPFLAMFTYNIPPWAIELKGFNWKTQYQYSVGEKLVEDEFAKYRDTETKLPH